MKNKLLLDQDPAKLEAMIKTNVHPYVYMSKYAILHFRANMSQHSNKNALLYTSSCSAFWWMPNTAVYAGTKAHNYYLGALVSQAARKSTTTSDLIDVQTLHPAGVSTDLYGNKQVGLDTVSTTDCV